MNWVEQDWVEQAFRPALNCSTISGASAPAEFQAVELSVAPASSPAVGAGILPAPSKCLLHLLGHNTCQGTSRAEKFYFESGFSPATWVEQAFRTALTLLRNIRGFSPCGVSGRGTQCSAGVLAGCRRGHLARAIAMLATLFGPRHVSGNEFTRAEQFYFESDFSPLRTLGGAGL